MATWSALLPTETSQRAFAAIDDLAQQYLQARRMSGEQGTTLTSARADAMTDLILGNASITTTIDLMVPSDLLRPSPSQSLPVRSPRRRARAGRRHHLDLVVEVTQHPVAQMPICWPEPDLSEVELSEVEYDVRAQLLDAAEVAANPRIRRDLAGRTWFVPEGITSARHGSLLPEHIATWLADPDTRIRVIPVDPVTGVVDGPASKAYRPGTPLARRIRARDGTCRFPGCRAPASRCDLDHVVPHPGGPTGAGNLIALCRAHHGFKHHAGWTISLDATTSCCTWTAPDGRSHRTWPQRYLDPSTTAAGARDGPERLGA